MMNPVYHFRQMRELLDEFEPSRERSLAATKLDECEMWLDRCTPTAEALQRDGMARPATDGRMAVMLADEIRHGGYAGPAQHTYTDTCDGFHEPGQCPTGAALMTAGTADGPPTLGQAGWEAFAAQRRTDLGSDFYAPAGWDDAYPDVIPWRAAWEASAAAVAAAAIARLDTPAEFAAAMAENVRLRRDLADAEAKLANVNWPLCPNGCGCRLGTEDADARDCACDGLCCYDEIEVSELFAERDKLRKELHERDAQLADALTPTAADFDHAAEIMRLRDACEAEIASLTDQRNRVSDTADIVRRQLRAVKAIADQHALGDSPRAILAQAVLDQLGEDDAEPQLAPGLTPVEAVRTAVAEEWQPRVDALRAELGQLRERLAAVAEGLEHRAEINRPSKVTEICDGIAASLRRAIGERELIATAGTEHIAAELAEGGQA